MAQVNQTTQDNLLNNGDTFLYYDKLHFIPVELKNEEWAARVLLFNKYHSQPFVDPEKARVIRDRMKNGSVDIDWHKKRIDPEKAEAKFFACDWKACPLDQHLDEILDSTVKEIPLHLGVKAVDEFSISNRQENNRKILNRDLLRNLINKVNKELGFPQLRQSDDPFAYVERMRAQLQGQQQGVPSIGTPAGTPRKKGVPMRKMIPGDVIQNIINQIDNSELLGVYNEYLHKEGVEIACELGMDYYLNVKNKFNFNYSQKILTDIKLFNKCCARMYTSHTTGTPVVEYYRPEEINISSFEKRDLSDHQHWHREFNIPYADFVRQFGAKLTQDQLLRVFELNRKWNGAPVFSSDRTKEHVINNARIRVGYMEFQSQDMEVYSDYTLRGNQYYKKMASDFVPGYKKNKNGKQVKDDSIVNPTREESHYNVWYKCYYIPAFFSSQDIGTFDFREQSKYIFQFGKLQDQERYGDDERFARSSLVGFYSERMSWYEIKESFMKEINHLWFLFQNDLSNVMPHGLNWIYDMIVQQAKQIDTAKSSPDDAVQTWAAKVKQTGSAITKMLKNADGSYINNVQPFTEIKSGHLEAADTKLVTIMNLYGAMLKALGQNDISEGEAPKPRTNLGSIQLALGASGKATFYIEEAYTDVVSSLGNKLLVYFKDLVDMGDSDRLNEFRDIVGQANMSAMQEIKSIPMRNLGLYVEAIMTNDQKTMVLQIAQSMASAGTLDIATAMFLNIVDNLKYAYAILVFAKDRNDKLLAAKEQQQQANQMQLLNAQQQTELLKIQAMGKVKIEAEQVLGQIQEQLIQLEMNLKGHWMLLGKEQINQNKNEQAITQSNIDKLNNTGPNAIPERKNMPGVAAA